MYGITPLDMGSTIGYAPLCENSKLCYIIHFSQMIKKELFPKCISTKYNRLAQLRVFVILSKTEGKTSTVDHVLSPPPADSPAWSRSFTVTVFLFLLHCSPASAVLCFGTWRNEPLHMAQKR